MLLFTPTLLLGIISLVSGAALFPARQLNNVTVPATTCRPAETTTVTIVSTVLPTLITVAGGDRSSILSSLSSVSSVFSVSVAESSENRPVSAPPDTRTPELTRTISVPIFTATEVSQNSESIFWASVAPNTTIYGYTSRLSAAVGTTTITVTPLPTISAPSNETGNYTVITRTIHSTKTTTVPRSAYTPNPYGWNSTTGANSSLVGATGTAPGTAPYHSFGTTVTETRNVSTVTTYVVASPTFSYSYGPPTPVTTHALTTTSARSSDIFRRQTCTLVYNTFSNGDVRSWCNNWDGTSAVVEATYQTTVTPSTRSAPPAQQTSPLPSASSPATPTETPTPGSSTTSAAAATATCGESGKFNITFDELPVYASKNDTQLFPPINRAKNFYDHFEFTDCWAYVPPPNEPFPPQAGDHLAECVISASSASTAGVPGNPSLPDGSFGAGQRASNDNYWFNATSAWVGCENNSTNTADTCDFVATGYQWDPQSMQEVILPGPPQHFYIPPCPGFHDCALQQIHFGAEFSALSSMNFYAVVEGDVRTWFIDTMEMSWWNNTCAAGLARVNSQ